MSDSQQERRDEDTHDVLPNETSDVDVGKGGHGPRLEGPSLRLMAGQARDLPILSRL